MITIFVKVFVIKCLLIFVVSFPILFAPPSPCCLVFQGWSQYQHKSAHLLHTARHSMCFSPSSNISNNISDLSDQRDEKYIVEFCEANWKLVRFTNRLPSDGEPVLCKAGTLKDLLDSLLSQIFLQYSRFDETIC